MSFLASLVFGLISVGMALTAGYGVAQFEGSNTKLKARAVVVCLVASLVCLIISLMIAVSAK